MSTFGLTLNAVPKQARGDLSTTCTLLGLVQVLASINMDSNDGSIRDVVSVSPVLAVSMDNFLLEQLCN